MKPILLFAGLLPTVLRGYSVAVACHDWLGVSWGLALGAVLLCEAYSTVGGIAALLAAHYGLGWPIWKAVAMGWAELWVALGIVWPLAGREKAMLLLLPSWMAGRAMAQDEKEPSSNP